MLFRSKITPKGQEDYKDVVLATLDYIELMKESGHQSHVYNELKTIAELEEIYGSKGEGMWRATQLANEVMMYPLKDAGRINFIFQDNSKDTFESLLKHITPDNMLAVLTAKGVKTDKKEHYYQAPYSYTEDTKFEKDQLMQDGYRTQQATKPQTLSYGMMDSPVGIAAWIIEKFYFWSDLKNKDIESVYSKDILLANIMVYIITKTFNSASWIYYGRREEGGRFLPKDFHRIETPTAAALFPAEMLAWPPRSYAERMYNIKRWTKMPKGGHFAALEQPELLIDDIRAFARTLR